METLLLTEDAGVVDNYYETSFWVVNDEESRRRLVSSFRSRFSGHTTEMHESIECARNAFNESQLPVINL